MRNNDEIQQSLNRLLSQLQDKDITVLSQDEIETIRELINVEARHPGAIEAWGKLFSTMRNLGTIGQVVTNVLKWVLFIVATYAALKSNFIQWVLDITNGGRP